MKQQQKYEYGVFLNKELYNRRWPIVICCDMTDAEEVKRLYEKAFSSLTYTVEKLPKTIKYMVEEITCDKVTIEIL